jgi:hypothetical protein
MRMHLKRRESNYITFPGSKVSQNDCKMWNKSYKYKNTYTVHLKHSKNTSSIYSIIDYEKAYDSIIQEELWHILTEKMYKHI